MNMKINRQEGIRKTVALLLAISVMTSIAMVKVQAADAIPNGVETVLLNDTLNNPSKWVSFYKGTKISNGTLTFDYENAETGYGEAVASPLLDLKPNQIVKFTYNSPLSTGAVLNSYCKFGFRMTDREQHVDIQEEYYAFMVCPGGEIKNIWVLYGKKGGPMGGVLAKKANYLIDPNVSYEITVGTVDTTTGVRLLMYINGDLVIDIEDVPGDADIIKGDPLKGGVYKNWMNFYTARDNYKISGATLNAAEIAANATASSSVSQSSSSSSSSSSASKSEPNESAVSNVSAVSNESAVSNVSAVSNESAVSSESAESSETAESSQSVVSQDAGSSSIDSSSNNSNPNPPNGSTAWIWIVGAVAVVAVVGGSILIYLKKRKSNI